MLLLKHLTVTRDASLVHVLWPAPTSLTRGSSLTLPTAQGDLSTQAAAERSALKLSIQASWDTQAMSSFLPSSTKLWEARGSPRLVLHGPTYPRSRMAGTEVEPCGHTSEGNSRSYG
jgi:hypothetical protein